MAWMIKGRLDSTRSQAGALAGCQVEVFFEQHVETAAAQVPGATAVSKAAMRKSARTADSPAPLVAAGRASATTDKDGRFEIALPDRTEIASKSLRFVVSAASGQTIGEDSQDVSAIKGVARIAVNTKDAEPIALKPLKDEPPPVRHVTGWVHERSGKPLPANIRVMLFGRKAGDSRKNPGERDLLVLDARTDKSGNFFGDAKNDAYQSIAAVVTGVPGEIPVGLDDEGRVPDAIPLVVTLPEVKAVAVKEGDCECETPVTPRAPTHADIDRAPDTYSVDLGTGRCVEFNTPNRAIEEFSFYSVVRTTEPAIRGITVGGTVREVVVDEPPTPATPPTTPPPPPSTDPRIFATLFKLALHTGSRETWGRITVTLITENGNRFPIYSKISVNELGGIIPNPDAFPEQKKLILPSHSVTLADFTVTPATQFDLRTLRKIEVDWGASNIGDAWGFKGISVSAIGAAGETIPILVNDMEVYIQNPTIANFASIGGAPTWTGSARILERTPLALSVSYAATIAPGQPVSPSKISPLGGARGGFGRTADRPLGRGVLDDRNPVDWDSTPTFHEATTIAHGHLLHFKQVWYADGYSLGDLLYSLPLAPGQKKMISVVDWERRERTERTESTIGSESVGAALTRDRDLGEVVTGALTESSRGGSRNTTAGVAAGMGAAGNGSYQAFNFGALLGVSGGYGESDSSAWMTGARNLSASSLQTLHDTTVQSASAVRGLRSSVVHTVSQGETMRATTEVVANHNHCHAVTVQYFEVLRHLKLVHELSDVQECLFVPLPMTEFDYAKLLRWAQPLKTYLQPKNLEAGFDAARRVVTNWGEVDAPLGRYADEPITSIAGELLLTVIIPLPPLPERPRPRPEDTVSEAAARATAMSEAVNPTSGALGILLGVLSGGATLIAGHATTTAINATKEAAAAGARALADELYAQPTAQERYDKFHHEILPAVVEGFVDQLEVYALVKGKEVRLNGVDLTLVSDYQPAKPLLVSLRGTVQGQIPRGDISQLIFKSAKGLPAGCRAIVNAATIRYRTRLYEHLFVDDNRVNDDIDLPKVVPFFTTPFDMEIRQFAEGTGAALYTPTDEWEQRRPRIDDRRLAAQLLDHLNDNLEFYHHAIWWTMDPNRRFMLLDGYYAPGSDNRSVASVVENRLIGIVGNSLVLPVARGVQLDPRIRLLKANDKRSSLLDYYRLDSPISPTRVSLPTRGVFAEAVMGACNSCEPIDDSKFWRWEDSPIDEPPSIEAISTGTRRTEPGQVSPSPFPTPIVSIQNAPAAPDPVGVGSVMETLTKQSFADMAGLAGTQANAAAAYSKAMDNALQFGKEASTLAQQAAMINAKDKALGAIDSAEEEGKIDSKDAKDLRVKAFRKMVGDTPNDEKASSVADRLKVIDDQEAKGSITKEKAAELRAKVMEGLDPEGAAATDEKEATTKLISKIPEDAVEEVTVKTPTSDTTIKAQPTRPRPTGLVSVDVMLRAFVPSPVWSLEVPLDNVTEILAELAAEYGPNYLSASQMSLLKTLLGKLYINGDARTDFDAGSRASSRVQARMTFPLDTRTMVPGKQNVYRKRSDGELYPEDATRRIVATPQWWYELKSGATPTFTATPVSSDSEVVVEAVQVDKDQLDVHFKIETQSYLPFLSVLDRLKDLVPDSDTSFGNLSKYADTIVKGIKAAIPTMFAEVTVHFAPTATGIEYWVTGTHDGFPSYEMYVNGEAAIRHQAKTGSSSFALLKASKVPVNVQAKPLQVLRGTAR